MTNPNPSWATQLDVEADEKASAKAKKTVYVATAQTTDAVATREEARTDLDGRLEQAACAVATTRPAALELGKADLLRQLAERGSFYEEDWHWALDPLAEDKLALVAWGTPTHGPNGETTVVATLAVDDWGSAENRRDDKPVDVELGEVLVRPLPLG